MTEDLHLSGPAYTWLLTIFYISYILFEPLALMWKIVPPHIWGAFCVLGWAVCGTLQAATFNWAGMMTVRFFLGAFEAGFAPGIIYLLSFFYLRHEVGFRCGIYLSAAPLASCFAGALAYGITSGHPKGISSWRLLFLTEGLPGMIAAVVTWFLLPDSPIKAKFLNAEERAIAKARAVRQVGKDEGIRIGRVEWRDVWRACCDLKVCRPSPSLARLDRTQVTDEYLAMDHSADVLQLQRLVCVSSRLPPHYPRSHGIHLHKRTRPLCTSLLPRFHCCLNIMLDSRQDCSARLHPLSPLSSRCNWIHHACHCYLRLRPLHRRFLRRSRRLPLHF